MDFIDKVKDAAQDVASQAQKATSLAQSKIEQVQTRRKADGVARNLGYAIVRQRTQGVDPGDDIEAMINEIVGLESEIAAQEAAAHKARETSPAPPDQPGGPPNAHPPQGPTPGEAPPAPPDGSA